MPTGKRQLRLRRSREGGEKHMILNEHKHVSASPHIRDRASTKNIMLLVVIALMPATIFGIWQFGFRALLHILITVATCVLSEYLFEHFMHREITIKDGSAILTGLLLALNLPAAAPLWIGILGGIFAIIVVKQLFGGLGQNIMNPALGARCFLMLSFTKQMTTFVLDGWTGPTPLAALKQGEAVNTFDMLIGRTPGTIGETSAIALLIGAIILLGFGVIDLRIPGTYIVTFIVFAAIFGGHGLDRTYLVGQLCGGGLMLGAWFMATDYVTSPITKTGQYVYGILLGIFTGLFRIFGGSAEGVSYAIIFSNILVPLIEKYTVPVAFGKKREKKERRKAE